MPEMKELGVLRVATPCRQSWAKMSGDERVRFCAACKLNVYDLSGLTSDEARALFKSTEGRLCVRFWSRADGTVITRDCPIAVRWKTWRWAAAAIATINLLAAALLALFAREPVAAGQPVAAAQPRPPVVPPLRRLQGFGQNNTY